MCGNASRDTLSCASSRAPVLTSPGKTPPSTSASPPAAALALRRSPRTGSNGSSCSGEQQGRRGALLMNHRTDVLFIHTHFWCGPAPRLSPPPAPPPWPLSTAQSPPGHLVRSEPPPPPARGARQDTGGRCRLASPSKTPLNVSPSTRLLVKSRRRAWRAVLVTSAAVASS